jgi:hypothetical protein
MTLTRALLLVAPLLVARPATGREPGDLGSSCRGSGECAPGLDCVDAAHDDGSGSPAGGMCTMRCNNDVDCDTLVEGALCLLHEHFPGPKHCYEPCATNTVFEGGLDPDKCHGRDDMVCRTVRPGDRDPSRGGRSIDACTPLCTEHDQCGTGRFCQFSAGICADAPPVGPALGEECDLTRNTPCQGLCAVDVEELARSNRAVGMCFEACVIGAPLACGGGIVPGTRACLGRLGAFFAVSTHGIGDLGSCVDLCTCTSDCPGGKICKPVELGGRYEALGVCAGRTRQPGAPDCLAPPSQVASCPEGIQRSCTGPAGCLGASTCLAGGEYSPCTCIPESGAPENTPPAAPTGRAVSGCSYAAGQRSDAPFAVAFAVASILAWRPWFTARTPPPRGKPGAAG